MSRSKCNCAIHAIRNVVDYWARVNAHILKCLSFFLFFLEGPAGDEDLEVDEEEFPNFLVSSGDKAPLQPAPIQHLSQEISSFSSQVSAEAHPSDNTDKTHSVSQSGSQTAPQVSAEAYPSDNMDKTDSVSQSGSQTAPQVSAEVRPLDNMDKTDSVSQSGSQIAPLVSAEAHLSDNMDKTDLVSQTGSQTASQTADTDLSSEQPQHLLDIPFKCDVAPLQPQAPLQSSSSQTRDPLIGGSGEANLSFELPGQEGKLSG